MSDEIRAIESFLNLEADLLDRTDLENWMNLYTTDGTYWMPVRENQADPLNEISILYENRTLMAVRCNNFGHRLAPSMEYPVRCNHITSSGDRYLDLDPDPNIDPADRPVIDDKPSAWEMDFRGHGLKKLSIVDQLADVLKDEDESSE